MHIFSLFWLFYSWVVQCISNEVHFSVSLEAFKARNSIILRVAYKKLKESVTTNVEDFWGKAIKAKVILTRELKFYKAKA
jgi:hypothetical protein